MAPIRRSRRLSIKSLLNVDADGDWQLEGAVDTPFQLLHGGSDVAITGSSTAPRFPPPSPSACTTTSSDSSPSIVTHLPFTPGSSHTRHRKEGHIPRPPNAFMIFRSWLWNKDNLKSVERDNRNVSRIAGRYWNTLSEAERAPFRSMAEEAKARHAQLYPEYRYAPGSQKKPKVVQRRSQRSADAETEKCKKVADLLLGGVTSHDLVRYLDDEHKKVKREAVDAEEEAVVPSSLPRNGLKRPAAACRESPPPYSLQKIKKQRRQPPPSLNYTPPVQHAVPFPVHTLPETEDEPDNTSTPRPLIRTPELVYPANEDDFVPTDEIPYLSLDCNNELTVKNEHETDFSSYLPSHLAPGAHSVFSGIKPESLSFAESCVFGAYTTIVPSPVPNANFDFFENELVPLGSPVFTNPFEPSTPTAEDAALLGTLDQLFGQPISPFTPSFPRNGY